MSDLPRSTLEARISKFIQQYGPDQLIAWLDEFEYIGGPVEYRRFKKLEKFSCDAFGISIADMHVLREATDARRVISYFAFHRIGYKQAIIARLLGGVSARSISNYIREAEGLIETPRANKLFYEAFIYVSDKLKLLDDGKD